MNRDEISRLELLQAAHPDGLVFPHLADAYRRAGRYAQAETVLNAGLRRHSDYSSAHVVLGRLRLDQGKHVEAEAAFRRVLELDPDNQVAMESLGQVSLEQGRLEEALTQFRRLSRAKPSDEIRERVRELEQRVAEMRTGRSTAQAAEPAGTAREPRVTLRNGSVASGDGAGRFPEPGEVVTETMAELYVRQGLNDRAAAVYRQLLQRNPGDVRLRTKLEDAEAAARGIEVPPDGGRPDARHDEHPIARKAQEARAPRAEVAGFPRRPTTARAHLRQLLDWSAAGVTSFDSMAGESAFREPASGESPPAESRLSGPPRDDVAPGQSDEDGMPAGWSRLEGEPREGGGGPDHLGSMARSLIAITDMLVGLLEYRDPFFRGSSSLTRLVAEHVAEEMGLSSAERVDLALAAVLRDLGRLAMGGRLVSKSGHQSQEGRRKIERHVNLALHLLEGIELPRSVRLAVRHHHERWDGAGYPDGLAGEAIPHLARVLAVVDSFGAMISPRSYRVPRKVPDAAREILDGAGSQYDPTVVKALMRVLARRDQAHLGFVQRPHILLVTPDQPGGIVTAAKLCTAGYLAEVSTDAAAARERLRRVPVAALVVSAEAGADAAAAFIRNLRVDPLFAAMPVVVVDADTVALRVRLLESGADVCFPSGITYAELQGTLGALVRRTLNAARDGAPGGEASAQEAPWLALQGEIEDFPLTWLLQVMKYDSRTAAIGIRTSSADGAIYLERGDAVHAQIRGGPKGEPALRRMLGWENGRFTVQPDARPRERTIETSIMHLLLTQAVQTDHAAAGIFGTVSDEA